MPNPEEVGTDGTYGRRYTIDRPGCRIHYWLAGPPDAPLVTLSHAALVDHTFFAALMPVPLENRIQQR